MNFLIVLEVLMFLRLLFCWFVDKGLLSFKVEDDDDYCIVFVNLNSCKSIVSYNILSFFLREFIGCFVVI